MNTLLSQIRKTRRVSAFPVGLVTATQLSTPIVDPLTARIINIYDGYIADRKFPMDMAGFAVNVAFFKRVSETREVKMSFGLGHQETAFLEALGIEISDFEPLADNCTKILAWHTRTVTANDPKHLTGDKFQSANVDALKSYLDSLRQEEKRQ